MSQSPATPKDRIDESIATQFVAARRSGQSLEQYPGNVPQDLNTAYAHQDAAIARFGGTICGWKVGRIQPPLCEQLGITRLFGPAWSAQRQDIAGDSIPVGRIFKGGFGAAEAEFMFRFGDAPPVGQTQFSRQDVLALIDAVFIGFEIASSPFAGINALGPLVTISDFGNNNGLLVGPAIPDWHRAGLDDWAVETRIDGTLVGTGTAAAFPGGPVESVRLLLENLVARGHAPTAGMLVSTGAVTGVHAVIPGQFVESQFGDFARIECTIAYCDTQ